MKSKLVRLIERVGLKTCSLQCCPKCREVGLKIADPEGQKTYYLHTTDYKKVCEVVPKTKAEAVAA